MPAGMEEIDIEALLAQLTSGQLPLDGSIDQMNNGQGNGNGMNGINLEELFASVDQAAATDDAIAEDMMKFLAGLENDPEPGPEPGNGNGNEDTNANATSNSNGEASGAQ